MLVDVTSLMQRERSALRLLYELLVIHYPKLPLGEFLPVGSAFAAIFPESGVEASKKVDLMQDIHHQYYSRLAPAMLKMARGARLGVQRRASSRARPARQDRAPRRGVAATEAGRAHHRAARAAQRRRRRGRDVPRSGACRRDGFARALAARPGPPGRGTGQDRARALRARAREPRRGARARALEGRQPRAAVQGVLERAEAGARARGREGLRGRRHRTRAIGTSRGGARKRRGRIKLGNVREMSYDDFTPPDGAFKVLVDYPWDEPGHTVDEDRLRATNVRKKQGPAAHGVLVAAAHEPDRARRAHRARGRPVPALGRRPGGPARDARPAGPEQDPRPGGHPAEDARGAARGPARRRSTSATASSSRSSPTSTAAGRARRSPRTSSTSRRC